MRIGFVICCLLGLHLCTADELEHPEPKDSGKRHQWSSPPRSAYATDSGVLAINDNILLEACNNEPSCLSDRAGLEAITQLHRQLDDDANGNVDLSESDDFLREELQYDSGYEKRQKAFHHNDDMHISVKELWEAWLRSEVHNWTVEQTVDWLSQSVDLPQYKTQFLQHRVTGATLPRLAVNNMQYLNNVLGIKDPIHKQKLALKAMDVVLFGPPKGSRWKDWLLASLLLGALAGGWAALRAGRASREQLQRMLRDMDHLRKAEMALDDMQKELEKARLEQESASMEKKNLEKKLREAGDTPYLNSASSDLEVTQLKAEIEMLRAELRRAEGELEDRCWAPPAGLQQWLQLTHEVENRSYLRKKHQAELQLQLARDACEKLRKKRSSLVGAFVSTHGKSIDDVDRSIVEARTALNEVTQELQERMHRWKQIERLCGFNIINNNGLQYLESALYRNGNGRTTGSRARMNSSQEDLSAADDASICGSVADNFGWRDDSSGSEGDAPHYPLDLRLAEARLQLEERLKAEARERSTVNKADDKRQPEESRLRLDSRRSPVDERRREPVQFLLGGDKLVPERSTANKADKRESDESRLILKSIRSPVDQRRREPVQFLLGGDNVNWTGEDLTRSSHTQSQPQLRGSLRGIPVSQVPWPDQLSRASHTQSQPQLRAPLPPPRRPVGVARSRSTDVVDDATPNKVLNKQSTLYESADTPTPTSTTPPEEESTDSSLMEDEGVAKPRRRRINLPFGKKAKTPA